MSQGIASILSTSSDTAALRLQASQNDQVDDEVIQQFEALFLQQMLKSMRTASLAEGLFQSEQSEFYRDMYDQQIAADLAEKQLLGIAQIINRQLGRAPSDTAETNIQQENSISAIGLARQEDVVSGISKISSSSSTVADVSRVVDRLAESIEQSDQVKSQLIDETRPLAFKPETPNEFVEVAYRYAQEPAEKLGLDPQVLVAIAALETGWGNHVPNDVNGSSNNYFGIKADSRWHGDHVNSNTLEFEQGAFQQVKQPFRAYESIKDSFNDYAEFLLGNDRYARALEFADDTKRFLSEIQNAGYATDPNYASKIMNVLANKAFSLR